jgi:hexosaminidase
MKSRGMQTFSINTRSCPAELRAGLTEIQAEYPLRFANTSRARRLRFVGGPHRTSDSLSVTRSDAETTIRYANKTGAFRALGRLLGESDAETVVREFSESVRFDLLGVMVDVSRNGVLRPETMKALMRRCALMGINTFIAYAEDTYEVPGEPFFGYLRGRYTQKELRDLDAYANTLGIQMFLAIQTLGHLGQVLQWPAYANYRDVDEVLIAGEKPTYQLIEKMIAAAAAPFRSRRLIVGMDEAHGLGTGRYLSRHGYQRAFDIFNRHLDRVRDICRDVGVHPVIWSDMYFRLGSQTNSYYDRKSKIPADVAASIPKDVQLAYWDYYHTEPDFYVDWINRHRALGFEPLVAGGVWTWSHFWAALPFSFTATDACMRACKSENIREVFVTLWGDDGMECDVFSALPGIQFFAEHGYAESVDDRQLRANFRGSCDADFDDWVRASGIDSVPCLAAPEKSHTNIGKWLLWQDPILGLMEPQIAGVSLRGHYEKLHGDLLAASRKLTPNRRLLFPARLARVLSLKSELRRGLVAAYMAGNKKRMKTLVETDLKSLRKALDELWKCHREMWLELYKPFGWEVIEQRYGAQQARLQGLAKRVLNYLDGGIDSIPEFETKLEKIFQTAPGDLPRATYSRVTTASAARW